MADVLPDPLLTMLERLKLTALRDRIDNLLDEAGRREMTLRECAAYVKEIFDLETVRVFGEAEQKIRKAAVVPGSGKDYISQAVRAGADVFISGDIGHHDGIDALEQGITIIDAGHYGLEQIFVPYMKEFLSRELPQLHLLTARQQEPFWYE